MAVSARAARFTEIDVRRAVKAAARSGVRDYRVSLMPDGTISIYVGAGANAPAPANSCDDLLEQ